MFEFLQNLLKDITVLGVNQWAPYVIMCVPPLVFILLYALIAVLAELKVSAWMQDRVGPMKSGWKGTLQPLADILKLLQKEDIIPTAADKVLFFIAPIIVFVGAYASFAALPFSSGYIPASLNIGVFYIIAVSSFGVVGIMMAGWSSNNKYSLFGAMRSVAQIISYEIPTGLAILAVVMIAGTLDLQKITELQAGGVANWFILGGPKTLPGFGGWGNTILIPLMIMAFLIQFVAGLAETNRTPFDIPEAESELVAGFHTEYSAMKFAIFFLAEYANMFVVSAVAVVLFFGGWHSPIPGVMEGAFGGVFWFTMKGLVFVFLQIWLRWTLPRLRVDQLMYVCWKVLTPFSLAIILLVGFIVVGFK